MDLDEVKAISQANLNAIDQSTKPLKRIIFMLILTLAVLIGAGGVCVHRFIELAFSETASNYMNSSDSNESVVIQTVGR